MQINWNYDTSKISRPRIITGFWVGPEWQIALNLFGSPPQGLKHKNIKVFKFFFLSPYQKYSFRP